MKSEKGFILITSIITTLVVFILVGAMFAALISHTGLITRQNNSMRAYNMAEAGLAMGVIQLVNDPGNLQAIPSINLNIDSTHVGTYSVIFTTLTPTSFRINSTGACGNMSRTLRLEVFQESVTDWVSLSNSDTSFTNGDAWYLTNDYVDGPVHTNGQLNIAGSPTFEGHVSSTAGTINYGSGSNNPAFNGGISFNTASISMPSSATALTAISTAASAQGGLSLRGLTTIEFVTGGKMWVTNANVAGGVRTLANLPTNGAIYISDLNAATPGRGKLKISGTLDGKVTIGATNDIIFVGDLKYAGPRDANGLPTSPDYMLGLVTGVDAYIDYETSLTDNLEIDAYIFAPNRSLGFLGYDWSSYDKGTLTLYGGIAQNWVSPLGMVLPRGSFGGYRKNYHYDERMKQSPPLYLPSSINANGRIRYVKSLWSGR